MPAITRYIFSQLLVATFCVTLGLTCAVWLAQSLRFLDYIVNRGLPAATFLSFVGLLLPSFLGVALPIATFCAVLFVYNRLTTDRELVALRAAGLSQAQLARPALYLALGSTAVAFAISIYLLPLSFRAFKDLQHEIRNEHAAVLLQEGAFNPIGDGVTVYVRERTGDGELRGVLVHDGRAPERPVTMLAARGALVRTETGPRVVMVDGNRQELDRARGQLSLLHFDRYTIEVAEIGDAPQSRWHEPKERFLPALLFPAASGEDRRNRLALLAEGHHRLVAPLYNLGFALVALAALLSGPFDRRGQGPRLLAATLCVGVLEVLALALQDLAARSALALPLMYLAAALPIVLCGGLLLRQQGWRPPLQRAA